MFPFNVIALAVLEKPLEKKAGRNFGPPGSKRLVYFIDDMNMPEVDDYGTVQPHTLIRQHLDYNHWYSKLFHSAYLALLILTGTGLDCLHKPGF